MYVCIYIYKSRYFYEVSVIFNSVLLKTPVKFRNLHIYVVYINPVTCTK